MYSKSFLNISINCWILIFLLCYSNRTFTQVNTTGVQEPLTIETQVNHSSDNYLGLFVDPHLSMRSGIENAMLVNYGIAHAEDKLLGNQWFPEDRFLNKSAGIACRGVKWIMLDVPIDLFTILILHEYYGHGWRYRELDVGNIEYHLEFPIYSDGDGYAHVKNYRRPVGDHEFTAIIQAGLEVYDVLQRRMIKRWMANQTLHYREASLYFWSWQDKFQYIADPPVELPKDPNYSGEFFDPDGYIWFLNRSAGIEDPDHFRMDLDDLKKKNMISLVNPYAWYALIVQLNTYFYQGKTRTKIPTIRIGKYGFMPNMNMSLTPFGPEYHLENYIRWDEKVALVDIRIGDRTFHKNWWGIGLQVDNILDRGRVALDLTMDVWKQPGLELYKKNSFSTQKNQLGMAFSVRVRYAIPNLDIPLLLITEVGYKSSGFLQGFELDATPIFMFGIGIQV